MAYSASANVTGNTDNILASQYNNLRAEVKAAIDGVSTHDVDITYAYTGWKISTITLTDNQGDADLDISCVITYTWSGMKPTQRVIVFSALGVTMTEVYTFSGWKLSGTARTLS